jgi:hypothetical protein
LVCLGASGCGEGNSWARPDCGELLPQPWLVAN